MISSTTTCPTRQADSSAGKPNKKRKRCAKITVMALPDCPWKRFWYPREGQVSLADTGFLLDPEAELAKYYQTGVLPFDSIRDTKCLVLLGEPGIGKSIALKTEFERVKTTAADKGDRAEWFDLREFSSEDRLSREILDSDGVRKWQNSQEILHLYLDSLDEGLLRIDNISRVLLSVLQQLPTSRLQLRIVSRPLDWPVTLENGLLEIWRGQDLRVFQLAPLRKVDVVVAAELWKIDAGQFIDEVISRDVVPFAIKPVTLKFLVGIFAKGHALPGSRAEVYFQGCERLCEEQNLDRRDSHRARGELTSSQRMAIAARIAALTQISNRSAIWLGLDENLAPQDLPLNSIVGGSVRDGTHEVDVSLRTAREALGTGLFSSRGLSRQGWQHQTYAEYLAAFHLNDHNLTQDKLRQFIMHPDGSGKVVPQLREVAVWLAGMNSTVFQMLARTDPEVLLRSDLVATTDTDRAALTKHLLESFEAGGVAGSLWSFRGGFARLKSAELAGILRPYISDGSRHWEARVAALEIMRACNLSELQPDVVAVALDRNDLLRVRVSAAEAIASVGDSDGRKAMRPLALGLAGDDPQDELKGYGLMSTWPWHLTAQELFAALTPIKTPEVIGGAYYRFLGRGIAGRLKVEEFADAMCWARQHCGGRDEVDRLHKLASEILDQMVDHIDQPAVASLLATALFERMHAYTNCDHITAKLCASGDATRRTLAALMFSSAAFYFPHGAFYVIDACALTTKDIPWMLDELSKTPDTVTRRLISEIISRRLDGREVYIFDAVLRAASSDHELQSAIGPLVSGISLGSRAATDMKEDHERLLANRQPIAGPRVLDAERLGKLLATNNPEIFFQIYGLFRNNAQKPRKAADLLPGWTDLDLGVKARILSSAYDYLRTRPPAPDGTWWKEGRFTLGLLAGGCALDLVCMYSPAALDQLGDSDWDFWTPVILAHWTGESGANRSTLLAKSYQRATSIFLATLSDIIDGEDKRNQQVFVVREIGEVWSEKLAHMLGSKINGGTLAPISFKQIIAKLLSQKDPRAKLIAQTAATGSVPAEGDDRLKAVYATAELISHDPKEWEIVWATLQANESFGVEVLQVVASEREYNSFATALKESEIADICIWISKHGLEKADNSWVTPSVALARWWNTLINFLAHKGTRDACAAIARLVQALPQYEGLKSTLRDAEERMRHATWVPLTPEEIIRIVACQSTPKLVISIHGIRTSGPWQKKVNSELQRHGFRHELLDYGFFRTVQLLMPWARSRKIAWFRTEYEKLVREPQTVPSVIAHSFGTYIVASAIEKYAEIRFDRVIFCGSIVRRDFEWNALLKSGRVGAILNECGGKDIWVKLAVWGIRDAGASGSAGFKCSGPGIYQRTRPRFRHSDYFYPLNYTNNWVPFLTGAVPSELPAESKRAVNWKFWLLAVCALLLVLGLTLLFLITKIH